MNESSAARPLTQARRDCTVAVRRIRGRMSAVLPPMRSASPAAYRESRRPRARLEVATASTVVLSITRNPRAGFDRKNSSELLLWPRKRQHRQLGIILWEGQFLKRGAILTVFDRFLLGIVT
jgi:hypothetical protein